MNALPHFARVWAADFEFAASTGERPCPVCLVAKELRTGQTLRLWQDHLQPLDAAPFDVGEDSLFVAYYAAAEMACFAALDWAAPANVLDLFAEFRNLTNGLATPCGGSLLGALAFFGLDGIGAIEKDDMRALVLRGGPWADDEKAAILRYCESDVVAVERLLGRMLPQIDKPRALLRGRYMKAVARMESCGVPTDAATLGVLRRHWSSLQDRLVALTDADYGVYEGRTFKTRRFEAWLAANAIPWPRLASGSLALDDDTFREMARLDQRVAPLRELRHSLSEMRLEDLAVGADGRNRCMLSAFRARSGRNQPSNSRFIFGPATWLRGLIQPAPDCGVAYVDWEQQEFGIAAALSGDDAMGRAYQSGDPYLEFAKQARAAPAHATKSTHGAVRDLFKACALAVQYGMGAESLAARLGQPARD